MSLHKHPSDMVRTYKGLRCVLHTDGLAKSVADEIITKLRGDGHVAFRERHRVFWCETKTI